MNGRIPHTESDPVLADVKAKPSGWPPANLDPGSGRAPQAASGPPAHTETTNLKSLRFQGIAKTSVEHPRHISRGVFVTKPRQPTSSPGASR